MVIEFYKIGLRKYINYYKASLDLSRQFYDQALKKWPFFIFHLIGNLESSNGRPRGEPFRGLSSQQRARCNWQISFIPPVLLDLAPSVKCKSHESGIAVAKKAIILSQRFVQNFIKKRPS